MKHPHDFSLTLIRRRRMTLRVATVCAVIPCVFSMLCACSDKTTASPAEPDSAHGIGRDSAGAAALGKATFSALVDGERISGGAVDDLQQQNAAHIIPGNGNGPDYLLFYLFDTKTPDDINFRHSFRVYLPKKPGPASDAHLTLNVILDADHSARYNSSTPSITISSLTAARVSGTFSATMTLSPDTPNAPKQKVVVTEGQFDVPMATVNVIPP